MVHDDKAGCTLMVQPVFLCFEYVVAGRVVNRFLNDLFHALLWVLCFLLKNDDFMLIFAEL